MGKLKVRRPIRFFIFLLLLSASAAIVIYLFIEFFSPLPETIVPDVIGLPENIAVSRIENMGLVPKVESRSSDSNIITNQRPEPGKIVKTGRAVLIILGKAGDINPIPPSVVVNSLLTGEAVASPEVQIEVITSEGDMP